VAAPEVVREVLAEAQGQGFIGPGPLGRHVAQALRFSEVIAHVRGRALDREDHLVDLGAGGGLPGLVLASVRTELRVSLVEGSTRRAAFLEEAVDRCGLGARVDVVGTRAEVAGRDPELRGRCTVVTARSFGTPSETAECAAPFLRVGGILVVSEPPEPRGTAGWPVTGLALLGLESTSSTPVDPRFALLKQASPCPDRYPRRVGVPRKRPLF
jgi:16S rRNA (guanine527-N7)-methyltransferase